MEKYGEPETWREEGKPYTGPPQESETLQELFQSATSVGEFIDVILSNIWLLFFWF